MEFELIKRYFSDIGHGRDDVVLGVGDDAAILSLPPAHELVVSTDTMVSGVHFFSDVDPYSLGHKALAVNLSDLAAMAARPAWVTLALTLPSVDEPWLSQFSQGFSALARLHGVRLVGGDTTCGPLAITVQAMGFVTLGKGWRRSGAKVGDLIYVTGSLGDAGLALKAKQQSLPFPQNELDKLSLRLTQPIPRVQEALALNGLVSAAIDLSDGLAGDLGHLLQASGVGAMVEWDALPRSHAFRACQQHHTAQQLSAACWQSLPLSAGDDYELCFTLSPENQHEMERRLSQQGFIAHHIGVIDEGIGLRCKQKNGQLFDVAPSGYQHFAN